MRAPAECGTKSGYSRHKRRKDPRCDPCWQAWADYIAEYRGGRKGRPPAQPRAPRVRKPKPKLRAPRDFDEPTRACARCLGGRHHRCERVLCDCKTCKG